MTVLPIDPSAVLSGAGEWQIPSVAPASAPDGGVASLGGPAGAGPDGGGFGSMLTQQIGKLTDLQDQAAAASQSLAAGTATDPSSVVMAVEKAQLAMQLAGQIRTKGAEALNDIFHTQI